MKKKIISNGNMNWSETKGDIISISGGGSIHMEGDVDVTGDSESEDTRVIGTVSITLPIEMRGSGKAYEIVQESIRYQLAELLKNWGHTRMLRKL